MIDYWQNLSAPMQTFVAIGAVSSLVLSIQLVLSLIGGDMDGIEAEVDLADGGEGGASGILSIRTIGAFFTGFGWTGASMTEAGFGLGITTIVSASVGAAFWPWFSTSWPTCTAFVRKVPWTIRMQLAKSVRSTCRSLPTEKELVKSKSWFKAG